MYCDCANTTASAKDVVDGDAVSGEDSGCASASAVSECDDAALVGGRESDCGSCCGYDSCCDFCFYFYFYFDCG